MIPFVLFVVLYGVPVVAGSALAYTIVKFLKDEKK